MSVSMSQLTQELFNQWKLVETLRLKYEISICVASKRIAKNIIERKLLNYQDIEQGAIITDQLEEAELLLGRYTYEYVKRGGKLENIAKKLFDKDTARQKLFVTNSTQICQKIDVIKSSAK